MRREPRAFVEDIVVSCDAIVGEAINYLRDLAPEIFARITQGRTAQ
jgi:hypothetical protein